MNYLLFFIASTLFTCLVYSMQNGHEIMISYEKARFWTRIRAVGVKGLIVPRACDGVFIKESVVVTTIYSCLDRAKKLLGVRVYLRNIKDSVRSRNIQLHPQYDPENPHFFNIGIVVVRNPPSWATPLRPCTVQSTRSNLVAVGHGRTPIVGSAPPAEGSFQEVEISDCAIFDDAINRISCISSKYGARMELPQNYGTPLILDRGREKQCVYCVVSVSPVYSGVDLSPLGFSACTILGNFSEWIAEHSYF